MVPPGRAGFTRESLPGNILRVLFAGLMSTGCLPTASMDDTGTPGCTNCYDGLGLRAKIQLSAPSTPALRWVLQICREQDCSETTGPVTVVSPEAHVQTGDPSPPWSDVYFDVGPSPVCNIDGVCIRVEIRPKAGASFQNGASYGIRVLSADTGQVVYDQRTAVEFTHHQCGSARACDQADVSLPTAMVSTNTPDAD